MMNLHFLNKGYEFQLSGASILYGNQKKKTTGFQFDLKWLLYSASKKKKKIVQILIIYKILIKFDDVRRHIGLAQSTAPGNSTEKITRFEPESFSQPRNLQFEFWLILYWTLELMDVVS